MSPSEELMEDFLLNTGKWALLFTRAMGYFPFTISNRVGTKSKHLEYGFLSWPVLYSFGLNLILVLFVPAYIEMHNMIDRLQISEGKTERFALSFLAVTTTLIGAYLRILGIIHGKTLQNFWNEFCDMYYKMEKCGIDLKQNQVSNSVLKSSRNIVIFYVTLLVIHVSFTTIWGCLLTGDSGSIVQQTDSDTTLNQIQINLVKFIKVIGYIYWGFLIMGHTAHSVLMLFFVKMYTAFLCLLTDKIESTTALCTDKINSNENLIFSKPCTKLEDILKKCNELYNSLEDQIQSFHSVFSSRLITQFLSCVLSLLMHIFFLFFMLGEKPIVIVVALVFPTISSAMELYSLGHEPSMLTEQARNFVKAVRRMPVQNLTRATCAQLQIIVSDLATSLPDIKPGNIFTLGMSLIATVMSAIFAYLVVLIQFRDSDKGHC